MKKKEKGSRRKTKYLQDYKSSLHWSTKKEKLSATTQREKKKEGNGSHEK